MKIAWYFKFIILFSVVMFVTSCTTINYDKGRNNIKGQILIPNNACYICACPDLCSGEEIPLSNAAVTITSESGQIINSTANGCGYYEVSIEVDHGYLLNATVANMVVKQYFYVNLLGTNGLYIANAYTTAQVIMFEVAGQLYPGWLKLSDIPSLVPNEELLLAVKAVFANCSNPSLNPEVLALAKNLIIALKETPCVCVVPHVTPSGPQPVPTPTASPTPPTPPTSPTPPTPPTPPIDP